MQLVAYELTTGLERLAMYVQGVDNVFALNFNGRDDDRKVTYGDVFLQAEQEYSRHNFEFADTAMLFEQFKMAEAACMKYPPPTGKATKGAPPDGAATYDQCIKASHVFNLLTRGVISVTERQSLHSACANWPKAAAQPGSRPTAAAIRPELKPPHRRSTEC